MATSSSVFSKVDTLTTELSALYEQWGYRKYSMAKFEEYSFYSDNRDFLDGKGVIAFNNSDGRLLALKPDITLSIVKNAKIGSGLTKLYYNESVFRLSEATKDFKEIKQTGVELLGSVDNYLTAEIIMLAALSLDRIDSDCALCLSHMAFIPGVLKTLNLPEQQNKRVVRCIREKNTHDLVTICRECKIGEDKIDLLTKLLAVGGSINESLGQLRALSVTDEMLAACNELEFVCNSLSSCNAAGNITIDLSVMNNIDYYNGIIFHGYVRKSPARVLSGGRYDLLASKIRESIGAIGFAVYLDNLNLYYKRTREYDADILIIAPTGKADCSLLARVNEFTSQGLSVLVEQEAPKVCRAKKTFRFDNGELKEAVKC